MRACRRRACGQAPGGRDAAAAHDRGARRPEHSARPASTTLEQVASYSAAQLAAMHGVGPIAITRLREALAEQGTGLAGD